eukprot:14614676-Heterocapsa_arctica.AAC.1
MVRLQAEGVTMCISFILLICLLVGAGAGALAMRSWTSSGRQPPPMKVKEKEKVNVVDEDLLGTYVDGQRLGGPRRRGLAAFQDRA